MTRIMVALVVFAVGSCFGQNTAAEWMNQGLSLFRSARYAEAAAAFESALAADPANVEARLYLGTAYLTQWVPGTDTPGNRDLAERAESCFRKVLDKNPANRIALESLASLTYNQKRFDDSTRWYQALIAIDPANKSAHYSLGVIAWARFYPEYSKARAQAGMKPQDPGPLPDFNLRADLRNRFDALTRDGIDHLSKALEIDPDYDDAMAYLNLLIRERADWRDTKEEYAADVQVADQWVAKALDTKRRKAASATGSMVPAPPPSPGGGSAPERIRVGAMVQKANLLQAPSAEYPPLALQARIQGNVRYQVLIGKDGHVANLNLISGHPLLVPSATAAVQRYVYKPTLLNGNPVEVMTQVDVEFRLPGQ